MASIKNTLSPSLFEDMKFMEQLHPWVHCNFPFLERVRADGCRVALSLTGFAPEEAGSESPPTQLLQLFSQGFYPKNLFTEIFDSNQQNGDDSLYDLISKMRANRVIFPSNDMDRYRKIFLKTTLWYFIPALCCQISANDVVPCVLDSRDWINIEFRLLPDPVTDPLPWLIGLLFEFSFPANVIKSPKIYKSNIKEIEMRIELNRAESNCSIRVSWPMGVEKDRRHAVIKSYCIKEVLETSPILQNIIDEIRVASKHTGKFDIEEESKNAAQLLEEQRKKDVERRGNVFVNTQYL